MAEYLDIPGNAGTYRYFFLDDVSKAGIQEKAGNYVFLAKTNSGWVPVYFGKAVDLSARIPNHEKWLEAVIFGATRVAAHLNDNALASASEESDLIGYWNPDCNTQHRSDKTA